MFRIIAFTVVLCVSESFAGARRCPVVLSEDITDGRQLDDGTIISDGVVYPSDLQFYYDGKIRGCVCKILKCVRKCCEKNYAMINKTCRAYGDEFMLTVYNLTNIIDVDDDHFHVIYNGHCDSPLVYRLSPADYEEEKFYVQKNGELYLPFFDEHRIYEPEDYCLDVFSDDQMNNDLSVIICPPVVDTHTSYGMIISMPFLLLTFFIYAILPDRNIHAKSLMCYVSTLFGAYIILVFIQLYPNDLSPINCRTLGMFCSFFFMVSFFWINVMSIDIWWTFSGLRGFSGSKREAERKRFLLYCGYAWGMPLLHSILVISLTLSDSVPKNTWYNPAMGEGQCWFREGIPTLIYFYGPMATLIVINITLFCVTACKIKQVQQDTAMLRKDESKKHSYENDKQRFNLYLKLMLAMGVNWSMEIISWIVDWQVGHVPPAVWYITDFCNALYGVFVFFIFVFKKKIWQLLKKRYYLIIGKPHLARTMTQNAYSPRTTATSLSQGPTNEKSFVNDSSILTSEVA